MDTDHGRTTERAVANDPAFRVRRIVGLAGPILLAELAVPLYGLVDTAIVGRLGTSQLAGVGLATTVLTIVSWCCLFLTKATVTDVARARAVGSPADTQAIVAVALVVAGLLGVGAIVLLETVGPAIVALTGAAPSVQAYALIYLRLSTLSVPGLLVGNVAHGYLQGSERMTASLVLSLAAAVGNLVLEVILVYGLHRGVAGSAVGTTLAVSAAGAWAVVWLGRNHVVGRCLVSAHDVRRLLAEGARQAAGGLAILVTVTTSTAAATTLGTTSLAAHHVALQLYLLFGAILKAICTPVQVLVAASCGSGRPHEARVWTTTGLGMGLMVAAGLGCAVVAARGFVVREFTHDPAVFRAASPLVVLAAVQLLPGAVAYITDAALLGARRSGRLGWNNVLATALFAVLVWIVWTVDALSAPALWCGLTFWMVARAALNLRARAAGGTGGGRRPVRLPRVRKGALDDGCGAHDRRRPHRQLNGVIQRLSSTSRRILQPSDERVNRSS